MLEALDPESLQAVADTCLALFEASGKAMHRWLVEAYVRLSGPRGLRIATMKARSWARMKKKPWPNHALAVVSALGREHTPEAFTQLGILTRALTGKAGGVAQRAFAEAARKRGLTASEAELHLAPSHGFDLAGERTLDFGSRTFTITLDADFKPRITDQKGKERKSLPKAGKSDDPELAAEAHAAFSALKQDTRAVLKVQRAAFEDAMVHGTTWRWEVWRERVLEPGLLRILAQRILWKVDDVPCRLVPGGGLLGLDDTELTARGAVGVLHPVELGPALCPVWADRFEQEGLDQPFPQLRRAVFAAEDPTGWVLPGGAVIGLLRGGWRANRDQYDDWGRLAFQEQRFDTLRRTDGPRSVEVRFTQTMAAMDAAEARMTVASWSVSVPDDLRGAVFVSEALRDLDRARSKTGAPPTD